MTSRKPNRACERVAVRLVHQPGPPRDRQACLTRPAESGTVFLTSVLTWGGQPADRDFANNTAFSTRQIVLL